MVEVRVRDQYHVDAGHVFEVNPRPPEPLQHEQPAGKVWIDQNVLTANLYEEPRVPDESNPQVVLGNRDGPMTSTDAGS